MRRRHIILVTLLFLSAALCRAEQMCPWLNAATAGGVLGGTVTVTVANTDLDKHDADCEFVRKQATTTSVLRIEVHTMRSPAGEFERYKAQCGSDATPLTAIGNEATICSLGGPKGRRSARAVGRVRNRAFLITLGVTDSSLPPAALSEKARNVAEQVAGNLF